MTGAEIDITPAIPEQIRALILNARALDAKKSRVAEERRARAADADRKRREAEAVAQKSAQQSATKTAAQKKALKFIRKNSGTY